MHSFKNVDNMKGRCARPVCTRHTCALAEFATSATCKVRTAASEDPHGTRRAWPAAARRHRPYMLACLLLTPPPSPLYRLHHEYSQLKDPTQGRAQVNVNGQPVELQGASSAALKHRRRQLRSHLTLSQRIMCAKGHYTRSASCQCGPSMTVWHFLRVAYYTPGFPTSTGGVRSARETCAQRGTKW